MTRNNTTFIGAEPTWANACVGENGLPGYWDYAKGFSQAATILIDMVIRSNGIEYSVDELIYPVCFNMRHSVELRLKGAIEEIKFISELKNNNLKFDLTGSHDIRNIWNFFTTQARIIDDRYDSIINRINTKILDIAEVDASGQTFRYPRDTDSQKHLVNVSIINFLVLKRSFTELEAALDDLHQLNKYLRIEYQQGSFTQKLSRRKLFEIASSLPPRATWSNESFNTVKEEIKERYDLSNRELSKSIGLIEKNYETAPEIDLSIPLCGVEEDYINDFFGHWFKLHELPSDRDQINIENSISMAKNLESYLKKLHIRDEIWHSIKSDLTAARLAGLSALFYFARELEFSERYIQNYYHEFREAEAIFRRHNDDVISKYFHIFNKTNAICNILKSLYFLRKTGFADQLVATYQLEEKFSWLDEARTRTLFKKPSLYGYEI